MPRPYTPVRVSKFGSFIDDVPVEIDEEAASTLANLYKIRNKLVRRKGTAPLGAALSPDADLNGLQWARLAKVSAATPGAQECLLAVNNGSIGDWFAANPGSTINGGSGVLTNHDANMTWINQQVYVGDGYSQNQYVTLDTGKAISLTAASSQYVSLASNATVQMHGTPFSVAGWVNCTSFGAQRTILAKWTNAGATSEYQLFVDAAGHPNFTILSGGGGSGVASAAAISTGAWHFIAGNWDGSALNLYVDGALVATAANLLGVDANTTTALFLGANNGGGSPSNFFNGLIDSAAIWRRALAASEVTTLWNAGNALNYGQLGDPSLSGFLTSLAAWWDLEESTGTRYDATTNHNDLTPQNSPTNGAGIANTLTAQQAMVAPPATACTAAADGAGTGTGNYTFVYAFLAANGQLSETSPDSNQVTLAGQRADLTGVTVSSEPGVTARYIFATGGARTDYVLVDILANNTATTVTVNLDGIISPFSPLQTGNTRFPPCRYLVENQSRMIGAWCATAEGDKSTVFISNQLAPWYSPAAPDLTISANGTRAQLQGPAAGEITGLCAHGDLAAVFTGGAGFLLIGTEAADFRLQRFSEHGCTAHRTIQSTRHLLMWLSADGVYVWDGAQVSRISDPVRETIAAMSATDFAKAHAFVWYDRFFLCWPGHCLWYDLLQHTWGTNTAWDWRVSTVTTYTSSAQQRIYAGQTGHARVWQLETGTDDNGTPITATWTSRDWDCGMPAHEKRVHLVECKWKKATGTATVTLYNGSGNLIQTFTQDLSSVDFTDSTIVRMLQSAVEQARDEHFRLSVSYAGSAADYELLAAGLQWMLAR